MFDTRRLGAIVLWPGGYAMTLSTEWGGPLRCCSGHESSQAAKNHGLVRLIEVASSVADRDIDLWSDRAEAV